MPNGQKESFWNEAQYGALVAWLAIISCGCEALHAVLTMRLLAACPSAASATCVQLMLGAVFALICGAPLSRPTLPSAAALATWALATCCCLDPAGLSLPSRIDVFGIAKVADETLREVGKAISTRIANAEPPHTRLASSPSDLVDFAHGRATGIVAIMAAFEPVGAAFGNEMSSIGSTGVALVGTLWWARRGEITVDSLWPLLSLGAFAVGAVGSAWTTHAATTDSLVSLQALAGLLLCPYALALDWPRPLSEFDATPPFVALLLLAAAAAYLNRELKRRLSLLVTYPHLATALNVFRAAAGALAIGFLRSRHAAPSTPTTGEGA